VESPFDRNFISKELNIVEDCSSKKVPLLYSILFGLKKEVYEPNQQNKYYQQDNTNSNNLFGSNSNIRNKNENNTMKSPIMTTSVNKIKDQSVNLNNSIRNNNSNIANITDKNYISNKEQPKPWIID